LFFVCRDLEIPFKLYDIPEVSTVAKKWTDSYLDRSLMLMSSSHVEKSNNNHFMYWTLSGRRGAAGSSYVPPTTVVNGMTFAKWLEIAKDADATRMSNASEHYYYMANAPPHDRGKIVYIQRSWHVFHKHGQFLHHQCSRQ